MMMTTTTRWTRPACWWTTAGMKVQPGTRGSGGYWLHCYSCQSLPSPESCLLRQRCGPRHRFCKTLVSHGDTESGPLTTYSAWCSDTCHPITKTVERTLMTVTCCESPLCNVPPWEGPEGGLGDPQWGRAGGARSRGVGGPWGCPLAVAMTLLLSLLCGIHFLGS
ncbi:glycosylphosphatidylinositol-anchored high density lipoprotein-binding protein 1 isoform X2 [Sorex fumeus]|uniref:glycosylphosphatidylinositol-anchored high density lipoprotein-binding protein 1 isoform X2 n=1 Tax=Sorex fumeus TaxID=62283 RepID=UPI0024AE5E72|nr:glycosylphosphatidylinositol-anchored high density lipoprotein-binding protein 1 isoform X2 [Sorex fumeus]